MKLTEPRFAWLPLTPRGVAAYARAGAGRLLAVQCIVALICGAVVWWFFAQAWFPTIRQAIRALPAGGEVSQGSLHWEGDSPVVLASGNFLSVTANPDLTPIGGSVAHVRAAFGSNEWRMCSLLGCVAVPYPRSGRIAFNRTTLEPWWDAREPFIGAAILVGTAGTLMLIWGVLGLLYTLPAWMIAVLANRELRVSAAWRIAGAALIPGALVMGLTIVLYGLGALDLVRLLSGAAAHLIVGWVYLAVCPMFLPRAGSAAAKANPFGDGRRPKKRNPFRPSGR